RAVRMRWTCAPCRSRRASPSRRRPLLNVPPPTSPSTAPPAGSTRQSTLTAPPPPKPAPTPPAKQVRPHEVLLPAPRVLHLHRVGRHHDQLLRPAADSGQPGRLADRRVSGPDQHS